MTDTLNMPSGSRRSPSRSASSYNLSVAPPTQLVLGSAADAEAARQNFVERERASRTFLALLPFRKKKATPLARRHSYNDASNVELASPIRDAGSTLDLPSSPSGSRFTGISVNLDRGDNSQRNEDDSDSEMTRWAFVYENQRGTMWFRTFKFSGKALFSFDPPPFQILRPTLPGSGYKEPNITLSDYPLPDGSWRWLSSEWMIDMRDGKVQHDGFEYNWSFGGRKWRPMAGRLNTGALVRRRRWARLMVRPVRSNGDELTSVVPPTIYESWEDVWKGDQGDWTRCRAALRQRESDGRKLELWEEWLGRQAASNANFQRKQWTEDEEPMPSEKFRDELMNTRMSQSKITTKPQQNWISDVLGIHGVDILQSFIYPNSRAKFLRLLLLSGVIPELPAEEVANSLQFWSRTQEFS